MMDTVGFMFQQTADSYADQPAIIETGRTLTFAELSDMADTIAESFPENIKSVGLILSHRAEMIAAILAVLKSNAMLIPAESDFPTGRITDMMTEAKVDFILTESKFLPKTSGFATRLLDGQITPKHRQSPLPDRATPESPAYVLYTSGTTGRPKGVCVRNRNVCHYVRAFAEEFHPQPGDIMLQYSVCSFDIFVEEVYTSLLNGAALAIPSAEEKKDLSSLMDFVDRHKVTMLSGFPYLLAEMNRLPEIPKSLRLLISGGDVLRGNYVNYLLDRAAVYNTYGPSETTVCASYFCCTKDSVLADGTYPVGKPVRGTKILLLDENGREVKAGDVGEICIFGGGVSLGYIGSHDEENRAFVPCADGGTMYRSGDLGTLLESGDIAFLRRKDDQVMILGKRVETAEVEHRLNLCSGVRYCAVRALTDSDGLAYLVGYVVTEGSTLDEKFLRAELAENLTPFMIPEFFVQVDEIPLNYNGKPDLEKLPAVKKEGSRYGNFNTAG